MKYLLTGCEGWIGSHFFHPDIEEYDLKLGQDILDKHQLYKAVDQVDLVFHLAGETGVGRSWVDPSVYYKNNTLGSANVFRVARELGKKVVYASTGEVYHSNSPYAASKAGAEAAAKAETNKGLDIVMLRILNPYGPGQPITYIIPKFINLARANAPITIHGTGEQRKDYIYITDIISAFWAAKELPAGTISDLGSGTTKSIKEIAGDIIALTNSKSELIFVPSPRPGEQQVLEGNMEYLLNIGWKPKVTWEEGLNNVRESLQNG